jgi:flagellin-like protein
VRSPNDETSMGGERGVSSVIGVILMVAVTVILAAAVGAFALQFAGTNQEPAPQVANADAEFLVTGGGTDQTVRITHRGGDTIEVSNLAIVVSFSDSTKQSRLVGMPTDKIRAGNVDGNNIWDGSYGGIGGALADNEPEGSDGEWSSGEAIEFRIKSTASLGGVDVQPGEKVFVKVVHEPSGNVVIDRTLTASSGSLAPADVPAVVASSTSSAASWPPTGARVAASD